jgi:ubiquinone/menaquinone biosynthesis C-methylase UbiE
MYARLIEDPSEEAFLYDLSVAPQWREAFNQILDEEVKLPSQGSILDVGCGTGDYTIGVASSMGAKGDVVGVDSSEARLTLARAKAALRKLENVTFSPGSVMMTGVAPETFDLVVADLGWHPAPDLPTAFKQVREAARPGASVAILCATRGSFDEFYSIYWEALHRESLLEHSPLIESLIQDRPTTADLELIARRSRLHNLRLVTRKHRLDFSDGATFLKSPLIANYFLPDWMSLISRTDERERLLKTLPDVIDDARDGVDFDVSIKATVLIGVR